MSANVISRVRPLDSTERALIAHRGPQSSRKPRRHSILIGSGKWPQVQAALRQLQARGLDKLVTRGWR